MDERTVLGDISAREVGICYSHEHIVIDESFTTFTNPDFLLNDIDRISTELSEVWALGVRVMVDSMPCGGGRNVLKLPETSRRSGIHILCPTGLHLKKYYSPGHWAERYSAEKIANILSDEIELGIDKNDTNGPIIERSQHRAGLIKVASGLDRVNDYERKNF